jgi:hypothetical protein
MTFLSRDPWEAGSCQTFVGGNTVRTVTCKSGLEGWQCHLRENYDGLEEFVAYCETYGIHTRLGFETPEEAWKANPVVQGSTDPEDLCKV